MILWYGFFALVGLAVTAVAHGIQIALHVVAPLVALRVTRTKAVERGLIRPAPFGWFRLLRPIIRQSFELGRPATSLDDCLVENFARIPRLSVERLAGQGLRLRGHRISPVSINRPNPLEFREVRFFPQDLSGPSHFYSYEIQLRGLAWLGLVAVAVPALAVAVFALNHAPPPVTLVVGLVLSVGSLIYFLWRYAAQVITISLFLERTLFDCLSLSR